MILMGLFYVFWHSRFIFTSFFLDSNGIPMFSPPHRRARCVDASCAAPFRSEKQPAFSFRPLFQFPWCLSQKTTGMPVELGYDMEPYESYKSGIEFDRKATSKHVPVESGVWLRSAPAPVLFPASDVHYWPADRDVTTFVYHLSQVCN